MANGERSDGDATAAAAAAVKEERPRTSFPIPGALFALGAAAALGAAVLLRPSPPSEPATSSTAKAMPDPPVTQTSPDAQAAARPVESAGAAKPSIVADDVYPRLPKASQATPRLWSAEELALHDGSDTSKPLLIALLGEVYDVGPGARFYAPGNGYSHFAGRDCSSGFEDGECEKSDEVNDISGVIHWRKFYNSHETYRFVGRLIGRYFDAAGEPTAAFHQVRKVEKNKVKEEDLLRNLDKRFSRCNSKFVADQPFLELWCDNGYHIHGSVPMHIYYELPPFDQHAQRSNRCACVRKEDVIQAG
eukprot:TRINITY_DN59139_c0_g1_i1.p1 TRINITY_DN59139_c0_g1~~TRINITY_DN59139_c0_g1_i1.p1  ORF type:complete len:305 (+),score=63.06 TRINITY_DN59139_c0_g1_i1:67-981(+)